MAMFRRQEGGRATYLNLDPRVREYARRKGVDPEDLTPDDVRQVAGQIGAAHPIFGALERIRRQRESGTEPEGYAKGGKLALPKIGRPAFSPAFGQTSKMKMPKGFKRMDQGGFINSNVPGRTDKHNVLVPSGSYVLPADHVSALGENNSVAGAEVVKKMFGPGTKFGPRLSIPKFAGGGGVGEPVPVIVAGGEVILPPPVVSRIGGGDIEKGHSILDRWVLDVRKRHISKLKSLKPPKGADE